MFVYISAERVLRFLSDLIGTLKSMQWSVVLFKSFGGTLGRALQLLSGVVGICGLAYGLHVLMVERAEIPVCSQELLAAAGQENFLQEQRLTIEVAGAVREPGVWQLAIGSRQADAVERAGGYSQRADRTFVLKNMNLAQPLEDGQKIYIPFEGELEVPQTTQTAPKSGGAGLISLNTASAKELQTLPGIGEVRAAAIIEGRPYTSLSELTSRKILTETLWKDIEPLVGL